LTLALSRRSCNLAISARGMVSAAASNLYALAARLGADLRGSAALPAAAPPFPLV